jgi:hypothetical protein
MRHDVDDYPVLRGDFATGALALTAALAPSP